MTSHKENFFLAAILLIFLEKRRQNKLEKIPQVYHQGTISNERMVSLMSSVLNRSLRPSLFIGTRPILNSIIAYFRPGPFNFNRRKEQLRMARDGAIVSLEWEFPDDIILCDNQINIINRNVVLILPGANTDASFGYIRSLMDSCTKNGWIAVCLNERGARDELTTPRFTNAAYTNDLR